MSKIFTVANVPPELEHAWLQHLRDFDTAHPGCHFEVMSDGPDRSFHEVLDMLRLNPELTITDFWPRAENNAFVLQPKNPDDDE